MRVKFLKSWLLAEIVTNSVRSWNNSEHRMLISQVIASKTHKVVPLLQGKAGHVVRQTVFMGSTDQNLSLSSVARERDRERERECVCVCVCVYNTIAQRTPFQLFFTFRQCLLPNSNKSYQVHAYQVVRIALTATPIRQLGWILSQTCNISLGFYVPIVPSSSEHLHAAPSHLLPSFILSFCLNCQLAHFNFPFPEQWESYFKIKPRESSVY